MQNQPDLSFVMPCFKDASTLYTAVHSLLDQDWKNIEVIVVIDGPQDDARDICIKINDPRFTFIELPENVGACKARNRGAELAKGRYLSFLPADAFLYPGNIRVWVETLDEHPECAFMYGGYKFVKAGTLSEYGGEVIQNYASEPFDPYLLETTNYIDGSFPIRREWFDKIGGWDPEVKSLQDWDFWLRVVKLGGKGFYFSDMFFETEMPHQGGLSFDSHANWIERTKQIKLKNGIPLRKYIVGSLGAVWHARKVAKMLDADFREMPSFKPHEYEAIYVIGFYPQFADLQGQMFLNAPDPNSGFSPAKKIVHFVGTDIWQLRALSQIQLQFYRNYFKNNIDVILSEDEFTQAELRELGINSEVVPIPPQKLYEVQPLPEKFSVAIYNPQVNKEFYQPELMIKVAKSLPDIQFKFFGDPNERRVEENMEFLGYLSQPEMDDLIKNTSCLLRMPIHDGLSLTSLEFIMAGRQVVSSTPVRGAIHVDRPQEHLIRNALQRAQKAATKPNSEAGYWFERLNHEKFKETMYKLFQYDPKGYWERRAESWDLQAGDTLPDLNVLEPLFLEYKPSTLLDIGCGSARWFPYFEKQGVDYRGIDISENLIKIAQEKFPEGMFKACKLEDIPKPEKKFDLGFCYTTLEHVKEEDMQKAADALNACAKRLILVEPINFPTRHYCHSHNYHKYFNIVKEIALSDKMVYVVNTEENGLPYRA